MGLVLVTTDGKVLRYDERCGGAAADQLLHSTPADPWHPRRTEVWLDVATGLKVYAISWRVQLPVNKKASELYGLSVKGPVVLEASCKG